MTTGVNAIALQLGAHGLCSLADYMRICLQHEDAGYYRQAEPSEHIPLGRAGDFITAPEISQIFGELLGAFLLDYWHSCGAPKPCILAEFGPGRGTLLHDILRTARIHQDFLSAVHIVLMESSPPLACHTGRAYPHHRHDSDMGRLTGGIAETLYSGGYE